MHYRLTREITINVQREGKQTIRLLGRKINAQKGKNFILLETQLSFFKFGAVENFFNCVAEGRGPNYVLRRRKHNLANSTCDDFNNTFKKLVVDDHFNR
jgi:hypothetical protein